jgi:uncharacterized membrane protein HdeD (DUF308 family)
MSQAIRPELHAAAHMVQRLWSSVMVSGLLAVILGVVILVWPGPSILVAAVLFGVYLLLSGIAQVFGAFGLPVSAGARILLFLSGAASVILAVLAFRHFGEGYAVLLLAIWIAVGFMFRGVATTAVAISDRAFPGRGWAILSGVISIIASIVVLAWPFDSIVIMALVVGIWLIVIGVMEMVAGFSMRRDAKKAEHTITGPRPDVAQSHMPPRSAV